MASAQRRQSRRVTSVIVVDDSEDNDTDLEVEVVDDVFIVDDSSSSDSEDGSDREDDREEDGEENDSEDGSAGSDGEDELPGPDVLVTTLDPRLPFQEKELAALVNGGARASRATMTAVPYVRVGKGRKGKTAQLGAGWRPPRSTLLPPSQWMIYKEVDMAGDCFFDSVTKAYNCDPTPSLGPIDANRLRQLVARRAVKVHGGWTGYQEAFMRNVLAMACAPADAAWVLDGQEGERRASPSPTGHRGKRRRASEIDIYGLLQSQPRQAQLARLVMSPVHYATAAEVGAVAAEPLLNIYPMVLNGDYGLKTPGAAEYMFIAYSMDMEAYRANLNKRYVLLYTKMTASEHYEPVIRVDATCGPPARPHYRAVFTAADLPPAFLATWESYQNNMAAFEPTRGGGQGRVGGRRRRSARLQALGRPKYYGYFQI